MADNITRERAEAIVAIVRQYANGATLHDIARDLPAAPNTRKLRSWLETMKDGGLVTVDDSGEDTVIRLTVPIAAQPETATAPRSSPSQTPPASPKPATPVVASAPPLVPRTTPRPVVAGVADPGSAVPAVRDRGPTTDTPPCDPPPLPPTPPAAAPADAADNQMMVEAVQYVVAYGIVPESAIIHLQQLARKEGLGFPAAIAFVNRLVALLTTLSATDAATLYGLPAAQYEQWVEHCALAGYPRRGVPAKAADGAACETNSAPAECPVAAPPVQPASGVLSAASAPPPKPSARPVLAAVGDRGQSCVRPAAHAADATSAADPAPDAHQLGATSVPPSRRTLRTAGWVSAVVAAGLGTYQLGNRLSSAPPPAATPAPQPQPAPIPPSGATTSIPAPIENRDSKIEDPSTPQFPPFPPATGAYVLVAGRWLALPRNNGQVITIDDDRPMPPQAIGMVIFSGSDVPPGLAATGGVIACIGAPGWSAAQTARYPALRNEQAYPPVELAALASDASGLRSTWWTEFLPGVTGIGDRRIPATLEHPAANVTLLRPLAALTPGRYAVCSGQQYFEFAVE